MTLSARALAPVRAFGDVFANPNLRRLQLAYAGSITGEWSFAVAVAVFAYDAGGPAAVGVVYLIRMLPAAVASPFVSVVGDRYDRRVVMAVADLVRAAAVASAAVVALLDGPAPVVYALAVTVALVATAFRPAQAALIPSLARTPEELTASNVASSSIEGTGSFAGPALGGLLLAATSPGVVFAATSATFVWSAALITRISAAATDERRPAHRAGFAGELTAGFRAILGERRLRLLVGLYGAQTLVAGALNVLIVVMALRLLDIGRSGVGFLNSATGIGGLVGAVAALALVGRRRLASAFGLGVVLWGLPIALIGLWPSPALALAMLGVVGLGNTVVDVAAFTLLQRSVADDVLARVFGVLESLLLATIGLGALAAPGLVSAVGTRTTLIGVGAVLPILTALCWRKLRAVDVDARVPQRELALLQGIPLFAPLTGVTLEELALRLRPERFAAGEQIVRQSEAGERFYVVASGEVDVSVDGRPAAALGAGDYFGEIALLRDVPRTATVTARTDVETFTLGRDEFVSAVTGHPESAEAAEAVVGSRLASLRSGVSSV
jgi:MFS family permease